MFLKANNDNGKQTDRLTYAHCVLSLRSFILEIWAVYILFMITKVY